MQGRAHDRWQVRGTLEEGPGENLYDLSLYAVRAVSGHARGIDAAMALRERMRDDVGDRRRLAA